MRLRACPRSMPHALRRLLSRRVQAAGPSPECPVSEPGRERMKWVALPGEVLKGAPPLWCKQIEGGAWITSTFPLVMVDPSKPQDAEAMRSAGWLLAVDAEGRSQ